MKTRSKCEPTRKRATWSGSPGTCRPHLNEVREMDRSRNSSIFKKESTSFFLLFGPRMSSFSYSSMSLSPQSLSLKK